MAFGYAPYLLKSISTIMPRNDFQFKITAAGFLKATLEQNAVRGVNELKLSTPQGQTRQLFVKYKQRIGIDSVSTVDNCDIDVVPSFLESEITSPRVAKISTFIDFDTIRKYQEDAVRMERAGGMPTPVMHEIVENIALTANALIGSIDSTLLGDVVFGVNAATGNNNAVAINLNKNAETNDLSDGFPKLLTQAFQNEMYGNLKIVGGAGLMFASELNRGVAGLAANGIDMSRYTGFNYYADLYADAATPFGVNNVGVFADGTFGFVDIDKYVAPILNGRFGVSEFFRMTLPVYTNQNDGVPQMMTFDVQLREIDCPTDVPNAYGQSVTRERGLQVIITKNYGLWQQPTNGYTSTDRLAGNNGALKFSLTNDCENCA